MPMLKSWRSVHRTAQIACDNAWVVAEGDGPALVNNAAGFQNIAMVGGLERCAGILFDQQDRDAKLAQSHQDAKDLAHDQRGETKARLVEQKQLRPPHCPGRSSQFFFFKGFRSAENSTGPILRAC